MGNIIKINERFSFERKQECWNLYTRAREKNEKTGKYKIYTSYYTDFQYLCKHVIEESMGKCKSLQEIRDFLEELAWTMRRDDDNLCSGVAKCLQKIV